MRINWFFCTGEGGVGGDRANEKVSGQKENGHLWPYTSWRNIFSAQFTGKIPGWENWLNKQPQIASSSFSFILPGSYDKLLQCHLGGVGEPDPLCTVISPIINIFLLTLELMCWEYCYLYFVVFVIMKKLSSFPCLFKSLAFQG